MAERRPKLRRLSFALAAALVVAALSAAGGSLLLARWLHTTATGLETTLADVTASRAVRDAIDRYRYESLTMLELGGEEAEAERQRLRQEVRQAVKRVEAADPLEREQLDRLEQAVETYLHQAALAETRYADTQRVASITGPALLSAQNAVREFTNAQLATASRIEQAAHRRGRSALILALTLGGLLPLAAAAAILAFFRGVERPLVHLSGAMQRFMSGDTESRAPLEGPEEVRESAQRFNELADALVSQRVARTTAIAGVAHDLRNPLSALRMTTRLLERADPCAESERVKRHIGVVARQVDRLERMLSDLVDVARIDAGQLQLELQRHDVVAIARGVAEMFERASPVHQISLVAPDAPVPTDCDDVRVEQILINLVSNAIKYSPQGGPVEIQVRALDDSVELSISDEGIGIAREELARLFEPFRRLKLADSTIPGAGLGLAVVRQLVALHHGSIDVSSRPGEGSTFRVVLPRRLLPESDARTGAQEAGATAPPG